MLFGPIYALFYSFPTSIIFGMIAQCDCFCVVMDMQTAGAVGTALLPLRLVQMLIVMALIIVFNAIFWAIMIVPLYILCLIWGSRMLYYWTCGRTKKAKVIRRRISKAYNRDERQQIQLANSQKVKDPLAKVVSMDNLDDIENGGAGKTEKDENIFQLNIPKRDDMEIDAGIHEEGETSKPATQRE
jgi:hypothetical protein